MHIDSQAPMSSLYRHYAAHNIWANARLFKSLSTMPQLEYKRDRKTDFKSIEGALSHIFLVDQMWMRRLSGEGPQHQSADTIPYPKLADLKHRREKEDSRILSIIESYGEAQFSQLVTYIYADNEFSQPLAGALHHMFSHQMLHRGEILAMLKQAEHETEPVDFVYYMHEIV
jgi:uncharacterized damage-inducible protein DinB